MLLALLLVLQEPDPLLERLGSPDPGVREEAARGLRARGREALPGLRRAARTDDPEVAARLRQVIGEILADLWLTPSMRKAVPDAAGRIVAREGRGAMEVFVDAAQKHQSGHPGYRGLRREDFEPLGRPALRAAGSAGEKAAVAFYISEWRIDSALPDLEAMLRDPDPEAVRAARDALRAMRPQDPAARRLVERLSSDDLVEREEAEAELRRMGRAAVPALERAARDGDAETSVRARRLLRIVSIGADIPPRLRRSVPGAVDRLAQGGAAWTAMLLEAADGERHPGLRAADLAWLAGGALKGARTPEEKEEVCEILERRSVYDAAPHVVELLEDPSSMVRRRALQSLSVFGAVETTGRIADLLGDPEPAVRAAANVALASLHARDRTEEIVGALADKDPEVRRTALQALARLDAKERWREAAALLEDPEVTVYGTAVVVLGELGATEAAPRLVPFLDRTRGFVRMGAALSLGRLGHREAIPRIVPMLGDLSDGVRRHGALALGMLGAREHAEAVAGLLDDGFDHVREAAAQALREMEGRAAVPALITRLAEEPEDGIREELVRALSSMKPVESVPALIKLTRHGNPDVRKAAVEVLAATDPRRASECFVERLSDERNGVQRAALEGLRRGGDRRVRPALMKLLEGPGEHARGLGAQALGAIGGKEAIDPLLKLLRRREPSNWYFALDALVQLGAGEAVPELMRMIREEGPWRSAAVQALSDLGATGAEAALVPLLEDADVGVRRASMMALSVLDRPRAVKEFRRLLRHEDAGVRSGPAWMLGVLEAAEAREELEALLSDPDPAVRGSALRALGALGAVDRISEIARAAEADELWMRQAAIDALEALRDPAAVKLLEGLLRHEDEDTCGRAAVALARMDARGSAPAVRKVLLRAGSTGRGPAAWAFCRLGSREGIEWALEYVPGGPFPGYLYLPLNAFRRPEEYERLRKPLPEALSGTTREILSALATSAGVELEPGTAPRPRWWNQRWWIGTLRGHATRLDALERLLAAGGYDAILEAGRLRIVSRQEAVRFWRREFR